MCFRIANIPSTWNQDDLLNSLKKIDPSLDSNGYELSLFPACQGSSQTALLNFDRCTECFQRLKPNDFNNVKVSNGPGMVWLTIDCHFYDLTPLNSPGEEVIAESASSWTVILSSC
jgi:predicted Zn-ribbon and HTH transcriptional regulator